jgi:hypothetical protein
MNRTFPRPLPLVDIPRAQYFKFLQGLVPDRRLPVDFGLWSRESSRSEMIQQAAGWKTVRISVDFEEFQAFAESVGLPLTYALLKTHAYQKWLHQSRHGEPWAPLS